MKTTLRIPTDPKSVELLKEGLLFPGIKLPMKTRVAIIAQLATSKIKPPWIEVTLTKLIPVVPKPETQTSCPPLAEKCGVEPAGTNPKNYVGWILDQNTVSESQYNQTNNSTQAPVVDPTTKPKTRKKKSSKQTYLKKAIDTVNKYWKIYAKDCQDTGEKLTVKMFWDEYRSELENFDLKMDDISKIRSRARTKKCRGKRLEKIMDAKLSCQAKNKNS